MKAIVQDVDFLWTADLTVGSPMLDERNRQMLAGLAVAQAVTASGDSSALEGWLWARLHEFARLLDEEEIELEAVGYPELALHRHLHETARTILRDASYRLQDEEVLSNEMLVILASETCSALSLWFPRHIVEVDHLFFPYVDRRFRNFPSESERRDKSRPTGQFLRGMQVAPHEQN